MRKANFGGRSLFSDDLFPRLCGDVFQSKENVVKNWDTPLNSEGVFEVWEFSKEEKQLPDGLIVKDRKKGTTYVKEI